MTDGPYLFDDGVTALAHAGTPVSNSALAYVRQAIRGDIQAVVPYASLIGAQHILVGVYGFSAGNAAGILTRLLDAQRIHWYPGVDESLVRGGFDLVVEHNIDGWDGYYAAVALESGAKTILTLDDDFERVDGVETELLLGPDEFKELNEYLGS